MENLISHISELIIKFSDFVWEWNAPFLVGAGIYFLIFSKLTPFKYIRHAFDLIRGKHTKQEDIGEVTHFQALTTALSGTCLLYTSPSPRDRTRSRMPSSA